MTMTFDAPGGRFAQVVGQSALSAAQKERNCELLSSDPGSDESLPDINGLPNSLLTKVIEGEIIPRLLMLHRDTERQGGLTGIYGESLSSEIFARLVLASDSDGILLHMQSLLDRGFPRDRIFLDLLAPVARKLGDMWVEDSCSFADVTLGLSRLHRVLHEIARRTPSTAHRSEQFRAFFAPVPGEQHTFGISMLEELFQHAGWDVLCEYNPSLESILQVAASKRLDVIGFSVGCEELLAHLPNLIAKARKSSLNRDVTIMVGGGLFLENPDLAARFDGATIVSDGVEAVQVAEQIVSRARDHGRAPIV